jgi:hypothetical protein
MTPPWLAVPGSVVTGELGPVELVLAAAAAVTPDELAVARMAAIRSRRLRSLVEASPSPYERPAGVTLLGGLSFTPSSPHTVSARVGRISRRTRWAEVDADDVESPP